MYAVFDRAALFNQDLSKWDTGAVVDMEKSKHTTSVAMGSD
jgi:surface protein